MRYSPFHPGNILALIRLFIMIAIIVIGIVIGFALKLFIKKVDQWRYPLRTFVCRLVIRLLGIELKLTGELCKEEGIVYVINHRTLIDGVIALALIPTGHVISKAEVKNYPIIGAGANLAGVIYVDRDNKENRSAVKSAIVKSLKSKLSILIFPEGTISTNRKVLDYKKGAFEAAIEAGTGVQAIAKEFMNPRRDFWFNKYLLAQYFITFSQWKINARVHFFEKLTGEDAIEFCQKVQLMTQAKLDEFQLDWKDQDGVFSS